MNKFEHKAKGRGQTVNLPGKGWCFHRGAKLTPTLAGHMGGRAIWSCPNCQNVAYLDAPDATSGAN